jgi:hypothetical protein
MTTTKKVRGSKVAAGVVAEPTAASAETGKEVLAIATTSEPAAAPAAPPVTAPVTAASPLADRVTQAIAYIRMAVAILALNAPALTTKQRKALQRIRKGGDKFIPQITDLAQQWSVQIRTQPIDAMTSAVALATALQPLLPVLAGFVQEVQDTDAQAQGTSWSTATALYSVLKRMSRKDPKLAAQLAPVAEFFAYRRPVTAEKPAAAKPGKESRRDAKKVAAAEEVVAEKAAPAAPVEPATPATPAPHT